MDNTSYLNIGTAIIALLTAIIAWMTYLSQKKTQENTKSLVKPIKAIRIYLFQCYTNLCAIERLIFILKNHQFDLKTKKRIYSHLVIGTHFDLSDFNNMFYEDEVTYDYYSRFKNSLSTMNGLIECLSHSFESNNSFEVIINEIHNHLKRLYLLWYWFLIKIIQNEIKNNHSRLINRLFRKKINKVKIGNIAQRVFENTIFRLHNFEFSHDDGNEFFKAWKNLLNKERIISEEDAKKNINDVKERMINQCLAKQNELYAIAKEKKYDIVTPLYDYLRYTRNAEDMNDIFNDLLTLRYRSNHRETEWQHYILNMIIDEKRKETLSFYLNSTYLLLEVRINRLFNEDKSA